MIVHILLLQARSNLSAYEERELGEALNMISALPMVEEMTWGPDFSGRGRGYTHGAVVHFSSREALQTYQDDATHKQAIEVFNRLAPERLVIDYEAGPSDG